MNYIVQKESLETVADSIRAKAGISEKLEFPLGWKAAVDGIQTGGGTAGGCGVVVQTCESAFFEVKNEFVTITEVATVSDFYENVG